MSNKAKRTMLAVVLFFTVVLSAACGNPGGSCSGGQAVGHITECAYRVVTGK